MCLLEASGFKPGPIGQASKKQLRDYYFLSLTAGSRIPFPCQPAVTGITVKRQAHKTEKRKFVPGGYIPRLESKEREC